MFRAGEVALHRLRRCAPSLEVADIFRAAGSPLIGATHAGHLSLHQLKVMAAIEHCRTAALGGHVEACEDCGHWRIAYNSCRNRHCPKCQGAAARTWLAEREADLLPVGYFHVVFSIPAELADIALYNKAIVYDLLFRTASETMLTIAADRRHLGARISITAVLHTWGSALTHHPHIHMIVPGGGISLDGTRWVSSRPDFLLPVRVLSKLFRRLFLTRLLELHAAGRLVFFGDRAAGLCKEQTPSCVSIAPLRKKNWVGLRQRPPFGGPRRRCSPICRATRTASPISKPPADLAHDESGVTFRYKDYRRDGADVERYGTMTLTTDEFIRRFLLHVLPKGFHRIRHYGLLASGGRKDNLARARAPHLLAVPPVARAGRTSRTNGAAAALSVLGGGRMIIIETFKRLMQPLAPPASPASTGTTRRQLTRHGSYCIPVSLPHLASAIDTPCAPAADTLAPSNHADPSTPSPTLQPPAALDQCPDRPGKAHCRERSENPGQPGEHHAGLNPQHSATPQIPISLGPHGHRGFVPRGLSYAKRRPKLFTEAVGQFAR